MDHSSSAGAVNGARVRALRDALGWSQMELAYRAGMTQAKLSNVENDTAKAGIRTDTLRAICLALDCSADFLLGLTDNPKRNP